jgi:peptide/nickel transport system substrate-binding protein
MAVDRDAIIKSILGGQATAISSFQGALSFGNDPTLKPVPYDPKQAKVLLQEAKIPAGAPVQIDIRTGNATFLEVSQAIASYLKMVGLNATVKPYESNYFLSDIVPPGKTGEMFQQSWGGWTLDFDNTAYLMYHTGEKWNPYDSDPTLDAMLESQRSMTDRTKREDILQAVAKYTVDNSLEMLLYNLNEIFAVSSRVKNFVAPPDTRLRLNNVTVE